jgi:uncharacterized protein DUF4833
LHILISMKKFTLILISSLFFFSFSPKENKDDIHTNSLFKIERSKDDNQIFYELTTLIKSGLNEDNPINIYWVKNTEGGIMKPLSWIQQHYAYGLEFTSSTSQMAKFHFVSYDKKDFTLKKDVEGNFKVFTLKDKKEVIVNRIFIQIDGGSFWFPTISRVELHTTDPLTDSDEVEIIHP